MGCGGDAPSQAILEASPGLGRAREAIRLPGQPLPTRRSRRGGADDWQPKGIYISVIVRASADRTSRSCIGNIAVECCLCHRSPRGSAERYGPWSRRACICGLAEVGSRTRGDCSRGRYRTAQVCTATASAYGDRHLSLFARYTPPRVGADTRGSSALSVRNSASSIPSRCYRTCGTASYLPNRDSWCQQAVLPLLSTSVARPPERLSALL